MKEGWPAPADPSVDNYENFTAEQARNIRIHALGKSVSVDEIFRRIHGSAALGGDHIVYNLQEYARRDEIFKFIKKFFEERKFKVERRQHYASDMRGTEESYDNAIISW